jgi:hypothetical protein
MTRTLARFTVFIFALTMSICAFAGSKSETVKLYQPTQVNGTTLPAGEYTVKYIPSGSTAQVKFLRNGKEVATANGQVKQLTNPPEVITNDGNGSSSISEIDFGNTKTGVTFDSSSMSSAGSQ